LPSCKSSFGKSSFHVVIAVSLAEAFAKGIVQRTWLLAQWASSDAEVVSGYHEWLDSHAGL